MNRRAPWPLAAFVAIAFLLLHFPILVLVAFSFNASRFSVEWTGFTLDWYRRLAERPDILAALRTSVGVGLTATAIATALGTLLAVGIHRWRGRGRSGIEAALYLPVVTPEIVAGISLLALFAAFRVPLGLTTVIVAHAAFCLPFVAIVVLARLAGMDASLEEAARTLGATEWQALRRVTLPLLLPGIVAGALLAFTLSFDDFVVTFFVAGPGATTLPLLIYGMVRKTVEPTINAVGAVVLLVTTLALLGAEWARRNAGEEAR